MFRNGVSTILVMGAVVFFPVAAIGVIWNLVGPQYHCGEIGILQLIAWNCLPH